MTDEILYMALELSANKWRVGCGVDGNDRVRQWALDAGDLAGLSRVILRAKQKLGLSSDAPVRSVYEAGRDGFWLHRWLQEQGIDNRVIDAGSVEVSTARKRRKTDRLDTRLLLRKLKAFWGGDRRAFSVVRVPPAQIEAMRRLGRERDRLVGEQSGHKSRIRSLLAMHGHVKVSLDQDFPTRLHELRCWDGSPLPGPVIAEIEREWARLQQVLEQLKQVESEQRHLASEAEDVPALVLVRELAQIKSIGWTSAWTLSLEMLGWRSFDNRKQVGALAGLTPTPSLSGTIEREQGIDKGGIGRMRVLAIELSWRWLRWQPNSELSQWFQQRYGGGSKRQRRIGIVALARRLLIQLWRYAEHGELPKDIVLQTS